MLKKTSIAAALGVMVLLGTSACSSSGGDTPAATPSRGAVSSSSGAPAGGPRALTPAEAAAASRASTVPPKNVVFKDLTDYEKSVWQKSSQLNSGHKDVPVDIVALEANTREQCQWSDAQLVEHLYARNQADLEQGLWDSLVMRGSFRHLCPTELARFDEASQMAMKQESSTAY